MRTITRKYKVYKFNELSVESQNKAINDYIIFVLDCIPYEQMSPDMKRACDEAERMQTPWFTGEYLWDYCKDEIIGNLEANDYDFTEDGEIFS